MAITRNQILFYCILAMIASLFFSRALLSVFMGLFVVIAVSMYTKESLIRFVQTPLLWSLALLFIIVVLTGLWSADMREWSGNVRVKLPLVLLPLAFASPLTLSRRQWEIIAAFFLGLMILSTGWCMYQYLAKPDVINEGYRRATTMPTPFDNDHVRYSWLMSIAFMLLLWRIMALKERAQVVIHIVMAVWLAVFLHILAARTGLLCLYLIILFTAVHQLMRKTSPAKVAVLLGALVTLPVFAWILLPSFRNKVKFVRWEMDYAKHADYIPGGSDATRVISFRAGVGILSDNPINGVGFGDVKAAITGWYAKNYPEVNESERIIPSNQFLVYGAGAGIPGLLLFTWAIVAAFATRVEQKGRWWLFWTAATIPFFFDIALEVQFGVFIYAFTILLFWKWFRTQT